MAQSILYTTIDGDRWDLIAWRYYRDVSQTAALIEANPARARAPAPCPPA